MPLISLETTPDLVENDDLNEILARITAKISRIETVKPSSVRAGHFIVRNWAMGEGAPAGYAHCQVSILAGRPIELQAKITDSILEELKQCFVRSLSTSAVNLTLEIREMNPQTFRRVISLED